MKNRVIVILNVDTEKVTSEGLDYALQQAFPESEVTLDRILSTPFCEAEEEIGGNLLAYAISQEVEAVHDGDYSEEQIARISAEVAKSDRIDQIINDEIDDTVERLKKRGEI